MNKNDQPVVQISALNGSIAFYIKSLGLRLHFCDEDPAEQEAFAFLKLEGGNPE